METKKIPFEEIYDIYAVRVIFENDDDTLERIHCWEIYTFFTDGHKVHPERLRDWTSTPKANGYRALHLTAMGPDGKWIEVQIRSRKMDEIAELGYAAHWKYKTGVHEDDTELDKWMNTIKDILANPEPNAIDFLDTIKLNLFSAEIYVFTPKGDLITLPAGSTVLDLAFAIHTTRHPLHRRKNQPSSRAYFIQARFRRSGRDNNFRLSDSPARMDAILQFGEGSEPSARHSAQGQTTPDRTR